MTYLHKTMTYLHICMMMRNPGKSLHRFDWTIELFGASSSEQNSPCRTCYTRMG